MSIRLGYQMPYFGYAASPRALFPQVIAQAREAEAAGFDAVLFMDHFYQVYGQPEDWMLEAYTALAGLATVTERIQLATLMTCNTYRNPALLAKIVTTLDVVSGGRAALGIGAGWFDLEHIGYGFEYGTFTERFQRLEEAMQIISPMLRGQRPTFQGTWYRAENAINEPRVRDDLPILLGGSGEQKTFGLAARYADHLNILCHTADLPRKLSALRRRCEEAGRDPQTLETSFRAVVVLDQDGDRARKLAREFMERDVVVVISPDSVFAGTPDDVAEQIQRRILDHGVDGIIVNMVANGHEPGILELAGKALSPLVH
ncbi:LLM class F420-dependent oxidoreductase [Nocardia alba]|nr:LLM class F420-dependent oxidoreductase [Nocardia alba]